MLRIRSREPCINLELWLNPPTLDICWLSMSPTERVMAKRQTEETKASAVVSQCGDWPLVRSPTHQWLKPQNARRKGRSPCCWPRAWRMAWSRSGTFWQVRNCLWFGEPADKRWAFTRVPPPPPLKVMLCLISGGTRVLWETWFSLRTGRSPSSRRLGIRLWGFGTWLTKVHITE